ncbi:HD domain-containing protein [Rhodopirellula sallentina]|uniref:HD domain-containing protein n=1 Tax=Rhodopirellula sallentina SM41 TaxID=1263870 RepID=M5UQT3_9BACT|nr:HD domain-containing protein [Rhodopirellula sallentina]EMI58348.1 hypothetical protein RSSM_00203 [Rhodopirellula sallentina SM41]
MYSREVSEYYTAKQKASRRICRGWVKPADLPTNAEIREQVLCLTRMSESEADKPRRLLEMRLRAAWWLRKLAPFHPKLIGSVLKGSIREGSDIDVHVFCANVHAITILLDDLGVSYDLQRKRIRKDGEAKVYTHLHVKDSFPIEITVYAPSLMGYRFRCSITGKPIERAGLAELERLISLQHEVDLDQMHSWLTEMDCSPDRANVFLSLLMPLESVKQNPKWHPEGDALYHSMQVFGLAKEAMPYDEEFLLAALLHDVGKAIDRKDHVMAGLEALEGFITPRTAWLIAHHMDVHKIMDHTIGARHRKRLAAHPLYEDLLLLGDCDRHGRVPGVEVDEPEVALDYIEQIDEMFA